MSAQLPIDRDYVLVAESFSGPIALRLGAQDCVGLKGIVLSNSFARSPRCRIWRLLPWKLLFRLPVPRWVARWLLLGPASDEPEYDSLRRAISQVSPQVLGERMREVFRVDAAGALSNLSVPLLDLRGNADRLIPRRCGDLIAAIRLDVVRREVVGPHALLDHNPADSWSGITEFIQSLRA